MPKQGEAPPEFYSREYFLEASAGSREYREDHGLGLDYYKARVLALASPVAGEVVLDLGCGRGEVVHACLRAGCETWGLDFSSDALALTQNTVERHAPDAIGSLRLFRGDACEVDLPAERVDCVIATDFVEHVLRDRLAIVMTKVHAWLKPGGRFVIHTSPTLGYMLFGQYVARTLELLRGENPQRLQTFARQLREGGHCSIQSVRSLRHLLAPFPEPTVWAEFSSRGGRARKALERIGATPLLAHHIFAFARKPH